MTNKELIDQAQDAKIQFRQAKGVLEKHEQDLFNGFCLMLDRLEKIEALTPLLEEMNSDAKDHISSFQSADAANWGYQEGVLISNQTAIDIYSACTGVEVDIKQIKPKYFQNLNA